jgi:hypothetical protein
MGYCDMRKSLDRRWAIFLLQNAFPSYYVGGMSDSEMEAGKPASVEEIQGGWQELMLRLNQLEAKNSNLERENKAQRMLLERVIDHRQKSHNELVLLLTNMVSKLPMKDVGGLVSRLVEHNKEVGHYLTALIKGAEDIDNAPPPAILKSIDQSKRELLTAIKTFTAELMKLDPPMECGVMEHLCSEPESFFSPRTIRANRCFVKGYVPRERVVREFGEAALIFFNDVTTDPKLNPFPKADEIALAFKSDFETLLQQNPTIAAEKRAELTGLYQRVQRSKGAGDEARAQRCAFLKLSFALELVHFYDHQETESPEAVFAQRLPGLIEQLVLGGPSEQVEEKGIALAESLLAWIGNADQRLMVINNIGKSGETAKTLKYVLRLRTARTPGVETDPIVAEFVKHLIHAPPRKTPTPAQLSPIVKLLEPDMQKSVVRAIMHSEIIRREEALALGKAIGEELGLKGLEIVKAEEVLPPEVERQRAWSRIQDLIARRADAASIAAEMRERLNARYDADEIRQSWVTLIEADALSLIKIICQLPYLPTGKTDPIARPVLETYMTRLTHAKYASTYNKVVNSLRAMFTAKPDNAVLLNFLALVRWASPETADKLTIDIGIPVAAAH